jgi:restriction endonuclease HindI-like protein/SWI2/SNF2 ATPase-like protein
MRRSSGVELLLSGRNRLAELLAAGGVGLGDGLLGITGCLRHGLRGGFHGGLGDFGCPARGIGGLLAVLLDHPLQRARLLGLAGRGERVGADLDGLGDEFREVGRRERSGIVDDRTALAACSPSRLPRDVLVPHGKSFDDDGARVVVEVSLALLVLHGSSLMSRSPRARQRAASRMFREVRHCNRNVIVIVDEAHRSHYDDLNGYARHIRDALPNAVFIAFTGTPISFADRNTREVFGPDIDVYDLTRAVADKATVPVYFEQRLIKVGWADDVSEDELDQAADEATLGLDDVERAQIEKTVAVINAIYGTPERLATLADDIVTHWAIRSDEKRKFISSPGKAFIVGATREICANLYEEITKLQPGWHNDADNEGVIKVVYSGSPQDQGLIAKHVRRDGQNKALDEYTQADRDTKPVGTDVKEEVVADTERLVGQLDDLCAGYDWRSKIKGARHDWMKAAIGLTDYLRSPSTPGNQVRDGEPTLGDRFRKLTNQLARAWVLCAGNQTLDTLRPTVKFYEQVRVWMGKFDARERQAAGKPIPDEITRLLATLVAESTASGEIVDIYDAAGLPKPSLSDLGPDFAARAKAASNPHLAIEALRAVLNEESTRATKNNLVRQRAFSERIADLMRRYTNQQLTSAQVIAALVEMAKEVAAEGNRGKPFTPPLSDDELAFYDAVATNKSAVELQGEEVLAQIARELVGVMQRDTKTDWTVRDDVRAKLRSSIKRLLVKYKYPPDKQPEAIKLVIEQMEAMAPRYAEQARRSLDGAEQ